MSEVVQKRQQAVELEADRRKLAVELAGLSSQLSEARAEASQASNRLLSAQKEGEEAMTARREALAAQEALQPAHHLHHFANVAGNVLRMNSRHKRLVL